jgi:photosystem II stability/assembly factor-like uncharacterized protein
MSVGLPLAASPASATTNDWQVSLTYPQDPAITAISCASASVCEAIGNNDSGIDGIPVILGTTDGGSTWTPQTLPATEDGWYLASLAYISCASTQVCEAKGNAQSVTGNYAEDVILGTADGGAIWTIQATPSIDYTQDVISMGPISCASTTTCEVPASIGSFDYMTSIFFGFLRTTDGGSTWTEQPGPTSGDLAPIVVDGVPESSYGLSAISCSTASVCEASGTNQTPGDVLMLGTTDGGATWTQQTVPNTDGGLVDQLSCPSATVCEAIDFLGFLRTTDGGSTWVNQNGLGLGFPGSISCSSTTVCEAVGSSFLLGTSDGGATWTAQTPPAPVGDYYGFIGAQSVSCTTSDVCFAAGAGYLGGTDGLPGGLILSFGGLAAPTFQITTTELPSASPGISYAPVSLQVANVGVSTSPYSTTLKWKKVALPKGLKLSMAGVLSGKPSSSLAAGPSSVTVQVTETVTTLNGRKKVKTPTTVQATIPLTIS